MSETANIAVLCIILCTLLALAVYVVKRDGAAASFRHLGRAFAASGIGLLVLVGGVAVAAAAVVVLVLLAAGGWLWALLVIFGAASVGQIIGRGIDEHCEQKARRIVRAGAGKRHA